MEPVGVIILQYDAFWAEEKEKSALLQFEKKSTKPATRQGVEVMNWI